MDRRSFVLAAAGGGILALNLRSLRAAGLPGGAIEIGVLETLPGKVPLIRRSLRPPNFETPVDLLDSARSRPIARSSCAGTSRKSPKSIRRSGSSRSAGPPLATTAEYSLDDLKRGFEQVEVVAVCQCSGNRRGLSDPHVPGVEWGYGAVGNARWKGVRLRDVLNKAGLKKEAVEIAFDGADHGVTAATPDFQKSIPPWKALDENTLLAWEMNGEPLPHLNGAPLRVDRAGVDRDVLDEDAHVDRSTRQAARDLLDEHGLSRAQGQVRVLPTASSRRRATLDADHRDGRQFDHHERQATDRGSAVGQDVEVRGIAWDGGYGIRSVDVSVDGGRTWSTAELGQDLGRFSFRAWSIGSGRARPANSP